MLRKSIVEFLDLEVADLPNGQQPLNKDTITISADNLEVYSPDGTKLVGPVSFKP